MNRTLVSLTLLSSALLLPLAVTAEDWPEVTENGLHRVHGTEASVVYADPAADLSLYQRIKLQDATVAFKKNWLREHRSASRSVLRVTSSDMEKIKKDLAELFHKEFTQALQESGYEVTDETASDVLLIKPSIINLDVNAPDTLSAGRSRSYTQSAGEMTLYVELYDSVTGDLLAKAQDRKKDRYSSYYTWTSSVTNKAAASRIIKGWAEILVNALNEAHEGSARSQAEDEA